VKFAAIDIGSNGVRLLLSRVIEDGGEPYFKKETFVRMPLRLGDDAFSLGRLSEEKIERLIDTLVGFDHLVSAYPARACLAVATSAMREAQNGTEVVEAMHRRTGIEVEIIDGKREAEIIYANHIEARLDPETSYVYVDVGGGSTEVTIIHGQTPVASRSFKIGTVRMLQGGVAPKRWSELKVWLKESTGGKKPFVGIGSGGNINKMFKLARIKEGKPLVYKRLREIRKYLSSFTFEQRVVSLGMRPDRADVIIPAAEIYLSVMKWARIKRMFVPQVGVSDGIIHILYDRHRQPAAPQGDGHNS
jgi:exopolyphosphatase/guanosine-5'-triphosphate,3'-diphosphate pyrophosphatase